MKYIEETEDSKRIYEVEMNEDRLNDLMAALDRDCYVMKFGKKTIMAYDKEEACKKIGEMRNHYKLRVNDNYEIISLDQHPGWYHGLPFQVTYEAVYKGSVMLVYYIEELIKENSKSDNYNCTQYVNAIINYSEAIDFYPFEKRVEIAANGGLKSNNFMEMLREYQSAQVESFLNKDYNFARLHELYQEVLKCFKFTLVEETQQYKSGEQCDLIMKLKSN